METGENLPKLNQDIIGSATSVEDIVSALSRRGCVDLTPSINLAACSDHPCAGGGFCDVYRGELYNGFKIAIKCLRVYDGPNGDNQRQKILKHAAKELYHWSKLRHRNVLPLVGLAFFRGHISMVSQWMDNGNLTSFLRLNLDANRMCFCVDVCAGLCYIHENGMVHGDLKAANVMVSSQGVAMITDFGNAQLRDITLKFSNTTSHGVSVRWAAPELLESEAGGRQASKEADIYAYGMTALEVLSGKPPYEGLSEIQVIRRVAINKGHPLRPQINLDNNLWELLVSCWTWSPDERPSITSISDQLCALHPDCESHSQRLDGLSHAHGERGARSSRSWEQLAGLPSPATPGQPSDSSSGTVVSRTDSLNTPIYSFSPLPQPPAERHALDSPPAGQFNPTYYQSLLSQEHHQAPPSNIPPYPASTYYRGATFRALYDPPGVAALGFTECIEPNSMLYPWANCDIPFPIYATQPASSDVYSGPAAGFPTGGLQAELTDVSVPPANPPIYVNQSNAIPEGGPIKETVQQVSSTQQAFERGGLAAVPEWSTEITEMFQDRGPVKGVVDPQGVLPSLVDDPPLSPPSVGGGPGPLIHVGSVGGAEVLPNAGSGRAKRGSEPDESLKEAPRLTPPREI